MKQYIISILIVLLIPSLVFGKCITRDDQKLINRSKVVFVGTITLSNFPTFKRLKNICKKSKPSDSIKLTYRVKPKKLLKGEIDLKTEFELKYEYSCFRSVRPIYFEQDQQYIFAAKSITDNELNLVSLVCGRWVSKI